MYQVLFRLPVDLISSATVGDPRKALYFIKAKESHTVMGTLLETPLEFLFISLFLNQNVRQNSH